MTKLEHRDSLNLRQRSTSVSADAYSGPSHNVSSFTHKPRPVSSASQYPVASSTSSHHDDGAETDRARERGRLSIKNEEEEEYYRRTVAGPSTARPRDAGINFAGGTSVGGTLAAGLVMKARDRRLGKPTGGSGEYSVSDLDDKRERERVLRLQRELSMKERETRGAKTCTAASIAGGSGISPTGVSNPAIPVRTPHTRKQGQTGTTTAARGAAPATAESIAIQLSSSTGRTLRSPGAKRARSPSTGPHEGMVEKVPAARYGGVLPPSNPRTSLGHDGTSNRIPLSNMGCMLTTSLISSIRPISSISNLLTANQSTQLPTQM